MRMRCNEVIAGLLTFAACLSTANALPVLAKSPSVVTPDGNWSARSDAANGEEKKSLPDASKAALLAQPDDLPIKPVNSTLKEPIKEKISVTAPLDGWAKYFDAAKHEYSMRRYETAENRLLSSLKIAKQAPSNEQHILLSRILLAKVALIRNNPREAEKLYSLALPQARHIFGENSAEVADCYLGQAQVNCLAGKFAQAELLCKKAVSIRETLLPNTLEHAESLLLEAEILAKSNWIEAAEETMLQGITMCEERHGSDNLTLSDAYRRGAVLMHSHGRTQEAEEWFDKYYLIVDKAAKLNVPPKVEGELKIRWEEGSPRSLEIQDSDFPLKYISINNVRVATTLIDLWELEGVLISITNTGPERITLGLGNPCLFSRSTDEFDPKTQKMEFIDPNSIDRIRRERVMWDLTQNRPWLANMQKTRSQRGFVPSHGHDLFRGPNLFGIYGQWDALSKGDLPQKFMLEPSPENVLYQDASNSETGISTSSKGKMPNMVSLTLEPFESRTGELFFLNTRPERMTLTIPVGNLTYEIPFTARRRRIK